MLIEDRILAKQVQLQNMFSFKRCILPKKTSIGEYRPIDSAPTTKSNLTLV